MHPRHQVSGFNEFAVETLADVQNIELANGYHLFLLSCLHQRYNFDFLFGDPIDWLQQGQGIYSLDHFPEFFKALNSIIEHNHEIYVVMPQPPLLTPELINHRYFHYIELPEFYGIYHDWFSSAYSNISTDQFSCKYHYNYLSKRTSTGRLYVFYQLVKNSLLDQGLVSFRAQGPRKSYDICEPSDFDQVVVEQSQVDDQLLESTANFLQKHIAHADLGVF